MTTTKIESMLGRYILASLMLCGSVSVSGQVTYGDNESHYIVNGHPDWMVTGNLGLPYDESGNTRYKLSGAGDNWFIGLDLGDAFFLGSPKGCGDFFNRSRFMLGASLGKWFSPFFGVRGKYNGWRFRDSEGNGGSYTSVHADIMFNISSFFHRSSFEGGPRWNVSPFIGGGLLRNTGLDRNRFGLDYGVILGYRVSDRVNVSLEASGITVKKDWDGYGVSGIGDGLYSLSIGISLNLGNVGWTPKKRIASATSYLSGLPYEDYGNGNVYRRNDYSGINSLKRRLSEMNDSANGFMSPVLFFFKINTTTLVDKQQMHNLDEIAHAVNAYDLKLKIIGAADSHTGNKEWNRKLSIARARYIAKCLIRRGVSKERMNGASLGGVDIYKPYPANRHTCVIVYKDGMNSNNYDYGNGE